MRTHDAALDACLLDVHPELVAEHGRPPTVKELQALADPDRPAGVLRAYCARLGLAITDGRALRFACAPGGPAGILS